MHPQVGSCLITLRISGVIPTGEFPAITRRTYTIQSFTTLQTWTAAPFRLSAGASDAATRSAFLATDVRKLRVNVPFAGSGPVFFKALLQ